MLLPFITTWILALAHSLLCFIPAYGQRLTSFGTIALAFVQALFLGGIGYQQLAGVTYFQSSIYRLPFSVVPGQPLAFFIDAPGLAFALLVSVLWLVTTIYMAGYCAQHQLARRARFYCWMQVSVMLALLAAFAANLVTLFIIYELLTLTTALLVLHKGSDKALKAGRFYLRLLLGSSLALLLPAVIWLTHNYGSGWHYLLHDHPNLAGLQLSLLVLLIVYGTSKTAMWPLGRWLPKAMVAEAPVSALLHAVAVVKVGVFALLRVLYFNVGDAQLQNLPHIPLLGGNIITLIASFTIIYAGIMAWRQQHLKPILAYSTIGQLGFCVAILSFAETTLVLPMVLIYMLCHAIAKISMFFVAGMVSEHNPELHLSSLSGIGRRQPLAFAVFTLAALSLIGLPLLPGYYSKHLVLAQALEGQYYGLTGAIIASTLLSAAYFAPLLWRIWQPASVTEARKLPKAYSVTLWLCCIFMLAAAFAVG